MSKPDVQSRFHECNHNDSGMCLPCVKGVVADSIQEYKIFASVIRRVAELEGNLLSDDLGPQAAFPIDWDYIKEYAENLLGVESDR